MCDSIFYRSYRILRRRRIRQEKNLKIPQNQEELLAEIAETVGKDHIAAISFGGAPMDFSFEKNVGAILHMYLGGQAVGGICC